MPPSLLSSFQGPRRILLAVAAPIEARAIAAALGIDPPADWQLSSTDRFDLLLTGVGKANAAAALAHHLNPQHHAAVLSLGIAGALPGSSLNLLDIILATHSIYADEGLVTDQGFTDIATMGFPPIPGHTTSFPAHPQLLEALAPLTPHSGPIATLSTCSGTAASAAEVVRRTNALAEAMEGAALAQTAARLSVPFAELRAISNTTGNRATQQWDIPRALAALTTLARAL